MVWRTCGFALTKQLRNAWENKKVLKSVSDSLDSKMSCTNYCDDTVIKTKMKVKLDPCKCHAVIMLRNYTLLWNKHNHGTMSLLSGENHLSLKCLSWMTAVSTKSKTVFRGFYMPEGLKLCLNLWRRSYSPSYKILIQMQWCKYFACIARDQSDDYFKCDHNAFVAHVLRTCLSHLSVFMGVALLVCYQ